jgi:hypothetical protein
MQSFGRPLLREVPAVEKWPLLARTETVVSICPQPTRNGHSRSSNAASQSCVCRRSDDRFAAGLVVVTHELLHSSAGDVAHID